MADKENAQEKDSRRSALYMGGWIFIMLAVLTFGEFLVGAIASPWGPMLLFVAFFKAFWVIKEYMHIGRAFSPDDEESH